MKYALPRNQIGRGPDNLSMVALLPLIAGGYAVGIAAGLWGWPGMLPWWLVSLVLAGALWGCVRGRAVWVTVGLAAVSLGWVGALRAKHPVRPACHVARHVGAEKVRVVVRVLTPAQRTPWGWRQQARAVTLWRQDRATPLCGNVEIARNPRDPPVWPPQRLLIHGKLRPAIGARNPGAATMALRYMANDIGARISAPQNAVVRLDGVARPRPWSRLREALRRAIDAVAHDRAGGAVVSALVLGDRSGLRPRQRVAFARAGLSHLLAVSGLHLTLVAAGLLVGVLALLRRLPVVAARIDPRRPAAVFAALATVAYTVLTGASPATVRACVMAWACFAAMALGRPPDWLRPFSLAALVLLAADPLNLQGPAFQLSFCAVVGIVLALRHPLALRLRNSHWIVRKPAVLVICSIGATLLTAPVVAYHFQMVSISGLVTNRAAVPWTSFVVLPASLLGAALILAWPVAGQGLLRLACWSASLLERLATRVSALDMSALSLSLSWVGALGGVLVAMAVLLTPPRWRRGVALVGLVLCATAAAQSCEPGDQLRAVFLDVGQGDSTFVQLPGGATMLIDGGGSAWSSFDPGTTRVVPFLKAAGVRRLDLVVASHLDADHAAGLVAVLEQIDVQRLWVCWPGGANRWLDALRVAAARRATRVGPPHDLALGDARVVALWPHRDGQRCGDPLATRNNNSIVLRIDYGDASLLFPGDIDAEVEELVLSARPAQLRATVLKVAHHGSRSSSDPAFLARVQPQLAVISCGRDNAFGFPHAEVLARYRGLGIPVARVDQMGAVIVRIDATGTVSYRGTATAR